MIHGSLVAIVTPFKNNEIDEHSLKNLVEFHIENGTHGIVPCGTTGESPTLSHSEHESVIRITIETVDKRVPVIAGTGSNSTKEAIRLTQFAQNADADAALVISPYYNKPTQDGLFLHFKTVADSVDIPIILYNVPGRTGVNISPETIARLNDECTNIVGVKEASGSVEQASKILSLCGMDFILLSGDDALNFPLLTIGGKGFITVTANIVPKDVSEIYNTFVNNDIDKSRELHYSLIELNEALFYETNPIPVKTALGLMGMIEDGFRSPLCEMTEENLLKLKEVLKRYKLI